MHAATLTLILVLEQIFLYSPLMDNSLTLQDTPKMCADGRFPPDFRTLKTVEELKVMDRKRRILSTYLSLLIIVIATALDRILRAYVLPTDLRSLRLTSRDSVSTKTAHQAKLCTLFDFLGAVQISERERMKRGTLMPY